SGAEALERASGDQRRLAPGEPAEQRADREDHETRHEDAFTTEDVRQSPTQEQEAPEDERVGADDPLQVLLREVQILLDRRQSDVHDRDIEDDHELHRAEERERKPSRTFRGNHGGLPSFPFSFFPSKTKERPYTRHLR